MGDTRPRWLITSKAIDCFKNDGQQNKKQTSHKPVGILKVQVNTQTYVEVQIEAEITVEACTGNVVLRMTEREAKRLARELADATKRNRKTKWQYRHNKSQKVKPTGHEVMGIIDQQSPGP